jgi:hypothetical protein
VTLLEDLIDSAHPLSLAESAWTLARLAAKNAARLALRKARTPERSHAEYEERWARTLREAEWERCATLEDLLFSTDREPHVALMDAKLVRIPGHLFRRYRHLRILQALGALVPPHAKLIELGCGVGGNLLGLTYHAAPWQLTGLELTRSGVACGRAIAERYRLPIEFDRIDLLDGSDPAFERLKGNAVFTYYCLEQIPHGTESVLRSILRAQPSLVVHIEPSYELLNPWKPLHAATWLYIRSRDYQRSLLATLRRLPVKILQLDLLDYAAGAQHFPMLVAWAPDEAST